MNTLYYGDNLNTLADCRASTPPDSVTFKKAAKEAFSHKQQPEMFTDTEAEDGE